MILHQLTNPIVALLGILLWFIMNEMGSIFSKDFSLKNFFIEKKKVLLTSYTIALIIMAILWLTPEAADILLNLLAVFGLTFTDTTTTGNALTPLLMGYMIISFVYKTKKESGT